VPSDQKALGIFHPHDVSSMSPPACVDMRGSSWRWRHNVAVFDATNAVLCMGSCHAMIT
jgi:hypothetical protein